MNDNDVTYARVVGSRIELHLLSGDIIRWPCSELQKLMGGNGVPGAATPLGRPTFPRLEQLFQPTTIIQDPEPEPPDWELIYSSHADLIDYPEQYPRDTLRTLGTMLDIPGAYRMNKPQLVEKITRWVKENKP